MTTTAGMLPLDGLEPGVRVLLTAGRCAVGAGGPEALRRELAAVDDWPALLTTARAHGLTGTLCKAALEHATDELPAAVADEYRTLRRGLAHRALAMSRGLLGVLAVLQEPGVRALAYKGPALSEGVYGDVAVRSWCDLDLIIADADVPAARRALEAAGFVPHRGGARLGADMTTSEQELGLHHRDTGLAIDLHWRVGLRFAGASLDGADLLRRAVPGEVLERPVLVPSAPDVALLCSLHGVAHTWPSLDLVLSTALALQALDDEQAAMLEDVARRGGCARRNHIGTLLSRSLLGARVAGPALLPAVVDRRAGRLAADAGARLLWREAVQDQRSVRRRHRPREHAAEVRWQLGSLDSPAAAAAHAWERLLRPGALDTGGRPLEAPYAAEPDDDGARSEPARAGRAQMLRAAVRRQLRIWR